MKLSLVHEKIIHLPVNIQIRSGQTSKTMIDHIKPDTSIKPGNDFYRYVNNNWMKENPIPAEYSNYGSFHVLHEENQEKLKNLFKELEYNIDGNKIKNKLSRFYKLGLDEQTINKKGLEPVKGQIDDLEKISHKKYIINTLANLHLMGVAPFFDVFADQDEKNSQMVITQLTQGGLGMPDRDYYLKTDESSKKIQEAYKSFIQKLFMLYGLDKNQAAKNTETIYKLEYELANASMSRLDMRDPHKTYHKKTIQNLAEDYPNLQWNTYIDLLGLKQIKVVILRQPGFFLKVDSLIASCSIDELRVYFQWNFLRSIANYVGKPFEEAYFNFYGKTLSGSEEMQARWKRVMNFTNNAMGEAVGKLYVKKHFPPEAKKRISELVENLRETLGDRINDAEWMKEQTKKKALEKLSIMKLKVGYPDKWKDYSNLDIKEDSFVLNVLRARKFNIQEEIKKIGKEADPGEWHMTPQTVNAYFNPTMNEIVFPAAILQPPFFDYKADDAVNYGGIGAVIAHEMTHGFDDKGRLYDKNGNLTNWWTKTDEKNFNNRASKLAALFNQFKPIDNININGELTLGENIADLGGVTISLKALENALRNKTNDQKINGLTSIQRFFISYANIWKQNIRDEELKKRLIIDVHSPAEFRVNGIVYNIPGFYESFNTNSKDHFYLKEKNWIKIW